MRDPATASARVFVGSIPHEDVTKKDLEQCFSRFGKVTGTVEPIYITLLLFMAMLVYIKYNLFAGCLLNRGFGFIQFEEDRSATEAINATDVILNGRRLGKCSLL